VVLLSIPERAGRKLRRGHADARLAVCTYPERRVSAAKTLRDMAFESNSRPHMQSALALQIPCRPASLRQLRDSLSGLDLEPEVLYALILVANELVANSIHHSDLTETEQIDVEVRCEDTRVRIDVRDRGTGFTAPPQNSQSGRGLPMVQALTGRFGISRNRDTHAWAEIELT